MWTSCKLLRMAVTAAGLPTLLLHVAALAARPCAHLGAGSALLAQAADDGPQRQQTLVDGPPLHTAPKMCKAGKAATAPLDMRLPVPAEPGGCTAQEPRQAGCQGLCQPGKDDPKS